MRLFSTFFVTSAALVLGSLAYADDLLPPCPAYNRDLPVNNQQVLHWKRTTRNQFQERAHVTGVVSRLFPDKNGHVHFEISLGKRSEDVLEIIYNSDFGEIPSVQLNMRVEACGDYITSTAQSGRYPPSPSGAILHWIHMNPSGKGHPPGYLALDGKLYGQDADNAGPKPYRPGGKPGRRHFEEN